MGEPARREGGEVTDGRRGKITKYNSGWRESKGYKNTDIMRVMLNQQRQK